MGRFAGAMACAGLAVLTAGCFWSAATGSPITGAPAVSNGRLYIGTQDGRLIAYVLPR